MKTFLDYVFYKVAKCYEYSFANDSSRAAGSVSGMIGLIVILIINLIKNFLLQESITLVEGLVVFALSLSLLWVFTEDKYNELKEKYKDEKHAMLKNYLVLLSFGCVHFVLSFRCNED